MIDKNLILITYLQSIIQDYKFKSEYSTNDNDIKVIIVQETVGEKEVLLEVRNSIIIFKYKSLELQFENKKLLLLY